MGYSEAMRDSEFAKNIPADWGGIVAGYFGGPNAAHVWAKETEWGRFPKNKKLPIWVGGTDGYGEAGQAIESLYWLGVPNGVYVALDMETRVDRLYVENFVGCMQYAGFKVFVYGSASTVFGNPAGNGYWVADYAGVGPFMHTGARLTQYASGSLWDSSTVKPWTAAFGKWWIA